MKKIFKTFAFAAVAAAAITACNKEIEITAPVDEQEFVYTFAIGEDAAMTKAVLASDANGKFAQWESGDRLGSITTKSAGYSNITPASGENPATFSIYSSGGLTAGNTITVWYPYGGTKQEDATAVSLEIPEEQHHHKDESVSAIKKLFNSLKKYMDTKTQNRISKSKASRYCSVKKDVYMGIVVNTAQYNVR